MPIIFKSKLSSAVANATFLDKTIDDVKKGKLSLYKVSLVEPLFIDDVQASLWKCFDTVGVANEFDANALIYATNYYLTNGENHKQSLEAFDVAIKTVEDIVLGGAFKDVTYASDASYEAFYGVPVGGEHYYNSTINKIKFYNGTVWKVIDSFTINAKGDLQTHDGTTLVTLPVGTNGQILTADSSETAGLKWINMPTSVSVTTKGDLQTHNGTNPDRLPVGSNGKVLSANSATVTGLEWIDSPASSGSLVIGSLQTIINGGTVTLIADDTRELIPVDGSGGAITLNTSPFGTYFGPNGKEVILITNEDTNTVTINKNDAVDGAIIVGDYDSIEISYAHPVKAVRYNNRWYLSRGL